MYRLYFHFHKVFTQRSNLLPRIVRNFILRFICIVRYAIVSNHCKVILSFYRKNNTTQSRVLCLIHTICESVVQVNFSVAGQLFSWDKWKMDISINNLNDRLLVLKYLHKLLHYSLRRKLSAVWFKKLKSKHIIWKLEIIVAMSEKRSHFVDMELYIPRYSR